MEFDTVKACLVGAFGRVTVIFDHASDFIHRQRARFGVPQLAEDAPARRVHGIGHRRPAVHLRIAEDARGPGVTLTLAADIGCLGNHQTRARTLAVIDSVQIGLKVFAGRGPCPRQRGHHDAVGRGDAAQLQLFEQRGVCWNISHVGVSM